jgi:hypothetical protein
LGALLVLVGLYLVVTGSPAVQTTAAADGFWAIVGAIFKKFPRVAIGIVLIVIGAVFLGVGNGFLG